ncbi:MAG: nicotinamidase, partial [Pseudomonadota bacterium]
MSEIALKKGDALLIVDLQKDFLPGGTLAVPGGDAILPRLNDYIERFENAGLPLFASRDWHPPDHCSFRAHGGPWPSHCVAETAGAEFAEKLKLPPNTHIISKATRREYDAYSAFQGTGLAETLRALGINRLFICGLATDYCVMETALDAIDAGFQTVLLVDAIRAIDAEAGDGDKAVRRIHSRGVIMSTI